MKKAIEVIKKFDNINPFAKYMILYGITISSLMLLFGIYLSLENIKSFNYLTNLDIISIGQSAAQGFFFTIAFAFVVDNISRRRESQ